MKKQKFFIRDREGLYLHFNDSCGEYYSHSFRIEGALYLDSYLIALTFCMGYNSIVGLSDSEKVFPSPESF